MSGEETPETPQDRPGARGRGRDASLPRRTLGRTARLAALPLGYAGRSAVGLGKRIGGRPAEAVTAEIQERTAEQVFRTLGRLKGGAMKFGQMLSVLEAALPEDQMAAYRTELTRLQDAAPPMPTSEVRALLDAELGGAGIDWRRHLVWFDGGPTAAASIGQVHRGRWRDDPDDPATEREVAVKVQYPGAEEAIASDLRQLSRLARTLAPLLQGVDVRGLVTELQDRMAEELDYRLEAQAQAVFAEAYRDDEQYVVPDVVAHTRRVLVTEWLDSVGSLAGVIADGTPAERDHYGQLLVRFMFDGPVRTGLLHADPHPGNFRILPGADGAPGRLGVLDFGAVARLPEGTLPAAMGRLIRIAGSGDVEALAEGLRAEGFVRPGVRVDPDLLLAYLAPFVEPTQAEEFTFDRAWLRAQYERLNDFSDPTTAVAFKLNLPPSYLLIHRTWLAGVGVLSQLGTTARFREILTESLPGFAEHAPD
ncbi:AarF/ABC1/UbiB kinase family protein [Nocardioides zeae]|uniref:AarF/ABC1/UbiB kinase family protein n=1 Tax=Nocardioides imazamoxiresistens TaxID=3231893 RepID=A0ABU3PYL1_9ACTN|nr:AarF/ABC1/UbiB kinase family protein [Nocardioides zeae]MDT9594350.1 AarF/ABC1/UbiB kinase family protein [Nocardioides zeae]